MAFIEIEGLVKNFGAFRALDDVNVSINEKEFVTFLGPSGCGKTTTLRLLAGFMAPDGGRISVNGADLSARGKVVPPEQRRMGMVFQNYAVWPHMSVRENVAFGLRYGDFDRKEHKSRVEQIMSAVGLEGLEDRHPAQLSGGQQQRVALARSLVMEPSILLLDEPLSNLDAKLRERMRAELKGLQRRTGITFVYVTHDQAEAMALSDRIAVFHKGTVQQIGSPREIYERPANLFVADFMGLVNRLSAKVISRKHAQAVVSVGRNKMSVVAPETSNASEGIVAIRPEAFVLDNQASNSDDNQMDGVIVEATFLGNLTDYLVDIGGATVRVQGSRRGYRETGTKIALSVPVSECVLMQDAETTETI